MLQPRNRERVLGQARARAATHWMIAWPCTSWCSWQKINGGHSDLGKPEGSPDGPQNERDGNILCEFSAKLFETVADAGDVPVGENTAPDAL